jgi:multiple sugar transport system permease protein
MVVTLLVIVPTSFMFGFFLSQRPPGYRWLRTIFFLPGMLSAPALAMIFVGMYMPDGIINHFLRLSGLDALTRVWLADKSTALGAVIAVDLWAGIGWYSVMFFAALSNISREVYEAAQIDGASYWAVMWRIAFPMSLDFVGVMALLLYLWVLTGSAQNVLLLTSGGPGDSSLTLGFYLYRQAFENRYLGYSQAIGVLIFTVGILGTLLIRRLTRPRDLG